MNAGNEVPTPEELLEAKANCEEIIKQLCPGDEFTLKVEFEEASQKVRMEFESKSMRARLAWQLMMMPFERDDARNLNNEV